MNNSKSSGIGCFLVVVLVILGSIFKFLADNPGLWVLVALVALFVIISVQSAKSSRKEKSLEAMLKNADKLDALAATDQAPEGITLSLKKGERALFKLFNAQLVEYTSTGSSFSSTNVGVSVPLFGRVRGNVGGSQGQITKNPDELTVVDSGMVIYTNQRIVFTGAKLVRDWEFDKVLNLDIGPNGISVRIAVSNRDRTSGLQGGVMDFGPGLPAAYAYTWYQEGEAAARKLLRETAANLRAEVAKYKAEENKAIEPNSAK